jgi:cathepsin A (carboxypeptidase C)
LGGFGVGNGATNWNYDSWPSDPETYANFQVISWNLYNEYKENNCFFSLNDALGHSTSPTCYALWGKILKQTSSLNWYDIYRYNYDLTQNTPESRMGYAVVKGQLKQYKRGKTHAEYTPFLQHSPQLGNHPLLGDGLSDYVNREDVREAMHIPDTLPGWDMCSSTLDYHVQAEASQWIYTVLRDQVRMIFYSGDTDAAVPTSGTRDWIRELNWPIDTPYTQWFTNGEVSGYKEIRGNFTFATVHGVGHMAPQWAREACLKMFTNWIHHEDF